VSRDRVATYRLQLHKDFTFADAERIADYLWELGVSHLYLSPILQSRPGSHHGYDVTDHSVVNEELGGIDGLRALAAAWPGEIIVDIVPNHMAVTGGRNRWWWDVLKLGPASDYATYFDIDWDPSEERLKRSILIPILGDHYGRVLEAGELSVELEDDEPVLRYYEHAFPLAPSSRPHDLDAINSDPDLLHEILEAQYYRLAYWKVAGQELNYRRFFAINDLAALRIDRPEVFDDVHRTTLTLLDEGVIHGLRVDHIDGLRYPRAYLDRLKDLTSGCYVVVEKILEGDETLRNEWPVDGTTGYESIARIDGLFVDPDSDKQLSDTYVRFTGRDTSPDAMAIEAKLQVMDSELAADIERLTDLFVAVCEDQRRYRDFTRPDLRQTLRETIASFDVYRTYVEPGRPYEEDAVIVTRAVGDAIERRPDLDPEPFGLLAEVLLGRVEGDDERRLAMRFQQATGPVMAKGVEDTLFYRYNRFAALNEVGGDPSRFGASVEEFHRFNGLIQERWPKSMRAGSTHDTKRSEDVRARLALLSEIPNEWASAIDTWSEHNQMHRTTSWPDRNLEYLLYQTLVGAWPLSLERATAYIEKAAKEAKEQTSWIAPKEAHDDAVRDFVGKLFADEWFMGSLKRFVEPLAVPGFVASLSNCLLRLTSPGVPDIYQGTETWDLSLVDPDNRRPVDYGARRDLMDADATSWTEPASGAAKLFLIKSVLAARAAHPEAFGPSGSYSPVSARGSRSGHVVAFLRGDNVVTIAPRLVLTLGNRWDDTVIELPPGSWRNVLTGEDVSDVAPLAILLERFPVALLERTVR
jgi:(1->4)-alpha-D-glucan 1-alpha-D-glucosylmutase